MCQVAAVAQKIDHIDIPALERILNSSDNRLFVVNFWATWCPPCVAELPGFEKASQFYDRNKVKFILVSLDFPSQVNSQLIPFLKKNGITIDVSVMTNLDYNSWIEKVDKAWQGDIPATLLFNNHKKLRYFHSGEIEEAELKKYINSFL
jgi:thiol-disulfide isomerase/thioredoxin